MDGINFEILNYQHVEQACNVCMDAFLTRTEPAMYLLHNQNNDAFRYLVLNYLMNACEQKHSLVAVDTNNNNMVVGVSLHYDQNIKLSQEFRNNFKRLCVLNHQKWIYKMTSAMAKDLRPPFYNAVKNSKKISLNKSGDILYMFMGGIHKDYAHKHISTNLVTQAIKRANVLNYKLLYVETSNTYSKNCFTKNSFIAANEIYYKNWEYPKGSNKYPLYKTNCAKNWL
eukprot:505599_1